MRKEIAIIKLIKKLHLHKKDRFALILHIVIVLFLILTYFTLEKLSPSVRVGDSIVYLISSKGWGYFRFSLLPLLYGIIPFLIIGVGVISEWVRETFQGLRSVITFDSQKVDSFIDKKIDFIFSGRAQLFALVFAMSALSLEIIWSLLDGGTIIYVNWSMMTYFVFIYVLIYFLVGLVIWFLITLVLFAFRLYKENIKSPLFIRDLDRRRLAIWRNDYKIGGLKPLGALVLNFRLTQPGIMFFYFIATLAFLVISFAYKFVLYLIGLIVVLSVGILIPLTISLLLHAIVKNEKKNLLALAEKSKNKDFLALTHYIGNIKEWPFDMRSFMIVMISVGIAYLLPFLVSLY